MNGLELKLARETLGLSQYEAAEHIGKVNQRSWAYWESGRTPVKEDVAQLINRLIEQRKRIVQEYCNHQQAQPASKVVIVYYDSPKYCASFLDWKFRQSLARTLAIDFGAVLVDFDKNSFDAFCQKHNLQDTPATRSEWAICQSSVKDNG